MTKYDDTNRGVLFKNNKKKTDRHPDYVGKLNVYGEEFFMSAWIRESKNGNKYMQIAIQETGDDNENKPEEEKEPF